MAVCIITCVLIPEADAQRDEDLERWIRDELEHWKDNLWTKTIERVKILSG